VNWRVVDLFRRDVDVTGVSHHVLMDMSMNIEGSVTKTRKKMWEMGSGKVMFFETLPDLCFLEPLHQTRVPNLIVITHNKTFFPFQLGHDFIKCSVVSESNVSKMVDVIVHSDHSIPVFDNCGVHFIERLELFANTNTLIVHELQDIRMPQMCIGDKPLFMDHGSFQSTGSLRCELMVENNLLPKKGDLELILALGEG